MPEITLKEPSLYEVRNEDAIYIYCRSEGKKRNQKYHYKFYCKIGRYKAEHKLDFNIDKNIREKIQNKEELFSFEIIPILTKLEKELSQQTKDRVLLSKIQEAREFFDSNDGFIESIDMLIQLRLESPDNIKYWDIALKQFNERLREKIEKLLNVKNKDDASGDLDELSEEDSIGTPNAYRNFFIEKIRPLISELIKIFFIHYEYFAAARYKVIAVCEEILLHLPEEQELSLDLYYILSNVHSYIDHDWRREQYNIKFYTLAKELHKYEQFPSTHKNEEVGHAGLRRMVHFFDNDEIDPPELIQRSARRLDSYKPNIVDIKVSSGQHVVSSISGSSTFLEEWTEIPKFSVITGVNGCGKTKILDSIDHALRNIGQPVGLLGAYLYADSESDLLRNVFGKRGNDFKYNYVYEKIIFYLDFENFQQRKRITQEASENLSAKIALAIVDRILCKTEDQLDYNWVSIIRDITKKKSDKEKLDFLATKISYKFILKIAEELTFRLNAITEPISFVKNICAQHLSVVQEIHNPNPSTKNNNEYDKQCVQHVKEHNLIIPPIENINVILQKYLKNFRIKYKWKENYKFKLLYNSNQIIDSSELGFYLDNRGNLYCKIFDEDQPLKISESGIGKMLHKKIVRALQDKEYINLDDEENTNLIYFVHTTGYIPGNYELIFYKDNKEIHVQNLSSGELVIIKLILWSYVSRGLDFSLRQHEIIIESQRDYFTDLPQEFFDIENSIDLTSLRMLPSKLGLLLLDEVDKHFDPKLSRNLMDILRHEFIDDQKKQAQVIMTSHKPDTLALVPTDGTTKIFTVKQNGDQTEVVETASMLALARVSRNVGEVTGTRVKVYTEGFEDAVFYQIIYKLLMNYETENANLACIGKLVSHRWIPEFHSVCFDNGNRGGASVVPPIVLRSAAAYKVLKSIPNSVFLPSTLQPFGVIDDDWGGTNYELGKGPAQQKWRILILKRHSLENYVYDPFILRSALTNHEMQQYIGNSELRQALMDNNIASYFTIIERLKAKLFEVRYLKDLIVKNALSLDYITKIDRYKAPDVTEEEKKQLKTIEDSAKKKLIDKDGVLSRNIDYFLKANYFKIKDVLDGNNIDDIIELIKGELSSYLDIIIFGIVDAPIEWSWEINYNKIKDFFQDKDTKINEALSKLKYDYEQSHSMVPSDDPYKITLINGRIPYFEYPRSFLRTRGHDIEECFQLIDQASDKNNMDVYLELGDVIVRKLGAENAKICIPSDLAEMMNELSYRIRRQINDKIKGDKKTHLASKVPIWKIDELKDIAYKIDGDIAKTRLEELLKDNLEEVIASFRNVNTEQHLRSILGYNNIIYSYFIFEAIPINPLLSIPNLLVITRKITGSMDAVNRLIALGEDSDIAEQIIEVINDKGIEEVINLFFTKPENSQKSTPLLLEGLSSQSSSPQQAVPSTVIAGIISLDLIESSPTIKYLMKEILKLDIELPKISNEAWVATHFVIGATTVMLLETPGYSITDKLAISGINSINYGIRIQLYNSVDKIGLLPTIIVQSLLTLANNPIHQIDKKHILYNVAISASISGMQYYQYHYSDPNKETTITETVLPYILDIVTAIFAIRGINLPDNNHVISYVFFTKQALMAISSIVTFDYMSKALLSFVSDQIKKVEDDIHSYFGNADTHEDINPNMAGEINSISLES